MLQTLGLFILVCGVSYHLARSSWQLVLLSFVAAGMGFAIWKVRKAIIRRTKIKALWKRSLEIEAMLDQMDEPAWARTAPVGYGITAANAKVAAQPVGNRDPRKVVAGNQVAEPVNSTNYRLSSPLLGRKTCVALEGPAKSTPAIKRSDRQGSAEAAPSAGSRVAKFPMDKLARTGKPEVIRQVMG